MFRAVRIACLGALIAIFCVVAPIASAATLGEKEAESLRGEVAEMMAAYDRGEIEVLIAKTHPALYEFAGGREALTNTARLALEKIKAAGIRFVSSEVGIPTKLYAAGAEELCFVPRTSVLVAGDRRVRSVDFMIAIRPVGGGEWKYIDGAGLRAYPEFLRTLFPALSSDVPLPPNTIEVL